MKLTRTNKTIDDFEKEIKRLLAKGCAVNRAVSLAYKKYPVMKSLHDEVTNQAIQEMSRGCGGKLPVAVFHSAVNKAWAGDGFTLSKRITKGSNAVVSLVAKTIKEAIKRNDTIEETALSLFDGYGAKKLLPTENIPAFMQELVDCFPLKEYGKSELLKQLSIVESRLKRHTAGGLKAAYELVKDAVMSGNDRLLNKAIYTATQERTRYYARRIARTELARAYHDGFMAQWADDNDCIAFKWTLSSKHPFCDICDLYAEADLYGMGKGIFPKNKVPVLPVHPHCMCHLRPVIQGSDLLTSEKPKPRIERGGREWFDDQSTMTRQDILGIYGEKAVRSGVSWTKKARGYSGKFFKGRLKPIADSLKPFIKDGSINIEDIAKRHDGETEESVCSRVWDYIDSPYFTREFTSRQGIHIKGDKLYNEANKKSYYLNASDIPISEVLKWVKKGEVTPTKRGEWSKRILISHPGVTAVLVNKYTGEEIKTHLSTVHFSNKGIHVVPRKGIKS
jgi:hypothetical protein